jgi:hypothetical protein
MDVGEYLQIMVAGAGHGQLDGAANRGVLQFWGNQLSTATAPVAVATTLFVYV